MSFGVMAGQPMVLNPSNLIFKEVVVKGFWGSKTSREMSLDNKLRLIDELKQRVLEGTLSLPVHAIYTLDDITTAVSGEVQKGKKGKVLLRV